MPRSALFRNSHPEAGQSSKSHQSSERLLLCLSIPVTDSRRLGRKESFISTPPHPIHPPSHSPSHPPPHPSILHPTIPSHPIGGLSQHRSCRNHYINPSPHCKDVYWQQVFLWSTMHTALQDPKQTITENRTEADRRHHESVQIKATSSLCLSY